MKTLTSDALDAAERFMLLNARLIDRYRFAYHFRDAPRAPVVAALRAYANGDGGFGNALEPDLRGAGSQPEPVEVALRILDEVDAFDDPMVAAACDWLVTVTTDDGGVPFVLPSVRSTPRAPWWDTDDRPPGALIPTASIAGLLHKHGIDHPWLGRATAFCWEAVEGAADTSPYNAHAVLTFLDHVPDRERAETAFAKLRAAILEVVELDPQAGGEKHYPLDFAGGPDGLARRLFDDAVIAEHLDALVDQQSDDGGWQVNFPIWTPVNAFEWNGFQTVERLKTLRAYGRLTAGR